MRIKKQAGKKFNSFFICVEEKIDNKFKIGIFYINKSEYIYFIDELENDKGNNPFDYLYVSKKVSLHEIQTFIREQGIESIEANQAVTIEVLNNIFKDKAFRFSYSGPTLDSELANKKANANRYFENRIEILKKENEEDFPFFREDASWKHPKRAALYMFNVGQANLSMLYIDNHLSVIFDLGYGRKCKQAEYILNTLNLFNQDEITTVVISHYDNDHINYAKALPNKGANLEFIMPDFLNASDIYRPNIQILIYKAIKNGNRVCFILNNHLTTPITYGPLSIYQGNKTKIDPNQSTDENSHGLVCLLNFPNDKVLIPGDVLYDDLSRMVNTPIMPTHFIVPHHGCKYIKQSNCLSTVDFTNLKESFVFAGPNGRYKHPNLTHLSKIPKPTVRLDKNIINPYIYNGSIKIPNTYCNVYNYPFYVWYLK